VAPYGLIYGPDRNGDGAMDLYVASNGTTRDLLVYAERPVNSCLTQPTTPHFIRLGSRSDRMATLRNER